MAKKEKPKKVRDSGSEASKFARTVEKLSYAPFPAVSPLHHMTFWVGAGFSKAWCRKAPTTPELLALPGSLNNSIGVGGIERYLDIDLSNELSLEDVRKAMYVLDMHERYPDVRARYFDGQNLRMVRKHFQNMVIENYENLCPIRYMPYRSYKFSPKKPTKTQSNISRFFRYLQDQSTGSGGPAEGLRIHFITTNYDFTIEEILDSCLGPDDAIFNYLYRGFTPRHVAGWDNPSVIHDNWLVGHLLKINGGFEIFESGVGGYELSYGKRERPDRFSEAPLVLLPSREQDYSHPYFQEIFPKAVRLLRESKVLIIVGYSLTEDDALLRFIVRQFSEDVEDGFGKLLFYVDPMPNSLKQERLNQVFSRHSNLKYHLYEGRFGRFVSDFLTLVPHA